jgi:hypothetical protein
MPDGKPASSTRIRIAWPEAVIVVSPRELRRRFCRAWSYPLTGPAKLSLIEQLHRGRRNDDTLERCLEILNRTCSTSSADLRKPPSSTPEPEKGSPPRDRSAQSRGS